MTCHVDREINFIEYFSFSLFSYCQANSYQDVAKCKGIKFECVDENVGAYHLS